MLMPAKWFTIAQCWRYDTVARGRKREHYQWNCDIWGNASTMAECELIACMCEFFKSVGLTHNDVQVHWNSKHILMACIEKYSNEHIDEILLIIDKLKKMQLNELIEMLRKYTNEPVALLDDIKSIKEDSNCEFMQFAKMYGITEWLHFDPTIVRGLNYYNGIVFEAFCDKTPRAIAGGGRYNSIDKIYGNNGNGMLACGFGFGDCVIIELKLLPKFSRNGTLIQYHSKCMEYAIRIASELRTKGIKVDITGKRIKKALEYRDKMHFERVLIIHPDDHPNIRMKYFPLAS